MYVVHDMCFRDYKTFIHGPICLILNTTRGGVTYFFASSRPSAGNVTKFARS